jgi:hypothetical protein
MLKPTQWRQKYKVPSNKKLEQKVNEYIYNKRWYTNSRESIQKYYAFRAELFIKLLGVTSPRNSVKQNLQLAHKTLDYVTNKKPIDFSYGLANKQISRNVQKVLTNKKPGGQKVNAFIGALLGDSQQIVIDSWMLKAFNIKRSAPTPLDVRMIKTIIGQLATNLNMTPCEIQACLWSYAKVELNDSVFKEDNDYSFYLKALK